MENHFTLQNVVHHGVEAISFAAIGSLLANPPSVCIAYAIGKITYIGTKIIIQQVYPQLSIDVKRKIAWTTCLLTGGFALHGVHQFITGVSQSVISSMVATAEITIISIGIRNAFDRCFSCFSTPHTVA